MWWQICWPEFDKHVKTSVLSLAQPYIDYEALAIDQSKSEDIQACRTAVSGLVIQLSQTSSKLDRPQNLTVLKTWPPLFKWNHKKSLTLLPNVRVGIPPHGTPIKSGLT